MPDASARELILKIHTRNMRIAKDIDFKKLATLAEGVSGADLSAIAMEAGMLAVREDREQVEMDHFLRSVKKVMSPVKYSVQVISDQPQTMFG
jgi:proteasome regulatory subunit